MSWLLRMRPVPLMPRDWASRCNSGSSIEASPVPDRRRGFAAAAGASPGPSPGLPAEAGIASGMSAGPERSSVVSLTKRPSKGAGSGHQCDRSTRWCGTAGMPGRDLCPLCRRRPSIRRRVRPAATCVRTPSAATAEEPGYGQTIGEVCSVRSRRPFHSPRHVRVTMIAATAWCCGWRTKGHPHGATTLPAGH